MAEVRLEHVYKRFGKVVAVEDFDLRVEDKEFLVLVGPSGCGKSTTLRMVAGLEDITQGTIAIGERVVNDVAPKDRDIAMVFQNYALYPHMNVYDNMSFGLRLRRTPRTEIQRRVTDAAKILQIEHLLKRRPKELSGGQRQRVALGRAIVREPQVFLMDEPLSNLDAKLRVEMRAQISKLHRRLETTVIYVTHDQIEAMTMGSRIVVMKDGLIMQVDSPIDLYENPENKFVAGFIGSPSMNFLTVGVEGGAQARFLAEGLDVKAPEKVSGVARYSGKQVYMGVRPEHIGLRGHTQIAEDLNMMRAKVEVVEPMGNETQIMVDVGGGQSLIARVDPHVGIRPGDSIELLIDLSKLHAFDLDTEQAIGKAA